MMLCFDGFGSPVEIASGRASSLTIESRVLFARVCQSLSSKMGADAMEPYTLWFDHDTEMRPTSSIEYVADPFDLPWGEKALAGRLDERIERIVFEDEAARMRLEAAARDIEEIANAASLQLSSDYAFGIEWDLRRYLHSFGFSVQKATNEPLLESLIRFCHYVEDARYSGLLVLVNLRFFLSENEMKAFLEQVFFSNLYVLILNAGVESDIFPKEKKYVIDQHLLENW